MCPGNRATVSVFRRESPVRLCPRGVTLCFPCRHLSSQVRDIFDTSGQALTAQDTQLDFCHVQPTPMLGRVVELEAIRNPLGLVRIEGLI